MEMEKSKREKALRRLTWEKRTQLEVIICYVE